MAFVVDGPDEKSLEELIVVSGLSNKFQTGEILGLELSSSILKTQVAQKLELSSENEEVANLMLEI